MEHHPLLDPNETLFHCQICGQEERAFYVAETRDRLIHHRICFSCDFWVQRYYRHVLGGPESASFIACGQAYTADMTGRRGSGHGGRRFTFQDLHTGWRLESRDVWHQGEVPERFRDLLPDDSVIIP